MVWLAKIAVIFTLALVGLLALIHARRIRARANAAVGWPAGRDVFRRGFRAPGGEYPRARRFRKEL